MASELSRPRGKNDRFTGSGLGKWFSTLGVEWWINILSSSCVLCYFNLFGVATILFSVLTLSSSDVIKNGEADVGYKMLFWPFWHQWDFFIWRRECVLHLLWAGNLFVVMAHLCFLCVFSSFTLRNPRVSFLYTKDYLSVSGDLAKSSQFLPCSVIPP